MKVINSLGVKLKVAVWVYVSQNKTNKSKKGKNLTRLTI
jgi:hypothetical protein